MYTKKNKDIVQIKFDEESIFKDKKVSSQLSEDEKFAGQFFVDTYIELLEHQLQNFYFK